MFGLFSGNKPAEQQQAPVLGAVINKDAVAKEIGDLSDSMKRRERSLGRHLSINAKERVLADKLATAYVHNYKVMVDITGLLNQFAEFFRTMKDLLRQSNIQLDQLNSEAFQNIEQLTRQEMDNYTNKFYEQSKRVQKLFQDYQMPDKARKLEFIPGMTQELTSAVDSLKAARAATGGKAKGTRRRKAT